MDENNVDDVYFRLYYIFIPYKCSMTNSYCFYNQLTIVKKKNIGKQCNLTVYFSLYIFITFPKVYIVFLLVLSENLCFKDYKDLAPHTLSLCMIGTLVTIF